MDNKKMMNPVLDDLAVMFDSSGEFHAYVEERKNHAEWLPVVPTSQMEFTPIDCGFTAAIDKAADYGASIEAYKDTVEGTRLAVKTPDGAKYLMRTNALYQAKQRLCIDGSVFNQFSSEQTALVLNTCREVNTKPALVRIADEKMTAWLSAKSYAIIESDDVYREAEIALKAQLGQTEFKKGFYSHTFLNAHYGIGDSSKGVKETLRRYREIVGEDYELECSVRTSDTGNCAITVEPRLVHKASSKVSIPLGAAMRVQHKGNKTMENLHEMFDMLGGALEKGAEKLEELGSINIMNPAQTLMRALKKVQIPASVSMEIVMKWDAINGDRPSTALAIYMAAQEATLLTALQGASLLKTYSTEDALARMLGLNWKNLDFPGDLTWN